MRFKEWLFSELMVDPGVPDEERPELLLKRDAKLGRPQAFPTFELSKAVAKRLRKAPPNDEQNPIPR